MDTTNNNDVPLVVDLDGTLTKTDLLYESANYALTRNPFSFFKMVLTLFKGRGALKSSLSEHFKPQLSELPVNAEVIHWLKAEKQRGRKLVLATASHEKLAQQMSEHFNFFDEVLATSDSRNLKSAIKRDALVDLYGEKGFDYIGDASADKPVWKAARYSHAVSPSASVLFWLKKNTLLKNVFKNDSSPLKAFMHALRPHQWSKNLLLFVPLLTAHLYTDMQSVWVSLLAFVIFSITASSVYVLNDLVDITNDRHHPRKCKRPFASGQLSILTGWLIWPILLLLAIISGLLILPAGFMSVLCIYYLSTMGYSFYFKRKPLTDVLMLAGLYTLRIIAGTTALNISPSFWLLSFSMCIFLSLAFMKRVGEFKTTLTVSNSKQLKGRGYVSGDFELISSMGVASGFLSLVFMALYIHDQEVIKDYNCPQILWLSCPLLLFWIARTWLITHRGKMHDDPVLFAVKDKVSLLTGTLLIFLIIIARYF